MRMDITRRHGDKKFTGNHGPEAATATRIDRIFPGTPVIIYRFILSGMM